LQALLSDSPWWLFAAVVVAISWLIGNIGGDHLRGVSRVARGVRALAGSNDDLGVHAGRHP